VFHVKRGVCGGPAKCFTWNARAGWLVWRRCRDLDVSCETFRLRSPCRMFHVERLAGHRAL